MTSTEIVVFMLHHDEMEDDDWLTALASEVDESKMKHFKHIVGYTRDKKAFLLKSPIYSTPIEISYNESLNQWLK